MSEEYRNRLYWTAGIAVVIFVIFIWPHQFTWDGDGSINAFPSSDSVKNYRLDATMTVTRHSRGYFHTYDEYNVSQADWPNGGTMELNGCVIKEHLQTNCNDQDNNTYKIDVQSYPDPPEPDNND